MDECLIRRLLKLFGLLNVALEESQKTVVFGGRSGKLSVNIKNNSDNIITVLIDGKTYAGQLGTLEYSGVGFPLIRYKDDNQKIKVCLAVRLKTAEGEVYTPLLSPEHVRPLVIRGYKLAANGMLGGDVVNYGVKMTRLFDGIKVLWGDHAEFVWSLHQPAYAHNSKIAEAVLACLRHGVVDPKTPTDARKKKAIFGFLTKDEWVGVQVMLDAINSSRV